MIINVSTIDDPRLDAYARLTEVQLRNKLEPEKGMFIAESSKVIERAVAGGMQPLSLLMEEKFLPGMEPIIEQIKQRYLDFDLPVFILPHGELKQLTGFELTRGALGAFRRPIAASVEEVCRDARRVAVLEDITNHTNVGAIFRSAAALGIDAVLVTQACYDPLYRRAVRVSWEPCSRFLGHASARIPAPQEPDHGPTTAFRCCTALDLKLPLWRCRTIRFPSTIPNSLAKSAWPWS